MDNYELKVCLDGSVTRIDIIQLSPKQELGRIIWKVKNSNMEIRDLWINVFNENENYRQRGYGSL